MALKSQGWRRRKTFGSRDRRSFCTILDRDTNTINRTTTGPQGNTQSGSVTVTPSGQ